MYKKHHAVSDEQNITLTFRNSSIKSDYPSIHCPYKVTLKSILSCKGFGFKLLNSNTEKLLFIT